MADIYTPPEAALETIEQRRQDPAVRDKVVEYLGGLLPSSCLAQDQPAAILARYVPRATTEDKIFATVAQGIGFVPYWASYVDEGFTTRNPEKVDTIRPPLLWQKGQKTRSWIVEPDRRAGGIGNLQTIYGNIASDYQRGLRELTFNREGMGELVDNTFDMGAWYRFQAPRFGFEHGNLARYYYPASMALATTFGALFEDFDGGPNAGNGGLAQFRSEVVNPAIEKVQRDLDLDPVIVRLPFVPGMNETDLSFLDAEQASEFKRLGSLPVQAVAVGYTNE